MGRNRVDVLSVMKQRKQARAERKRLRKVKREGKKDAYTLTQKQRQRAEARWQRMEKLVLVPSQLPQLPGEGATEQEWNQYNHLVKAYFTAIECEDLPTIPADLPPVASIALQRKYQHAVEVYDRRVRQEEEAKAAREAFAKRPLQKPQPPQSGPVRQPGDDGELHYCPDCPPSRKAMARYEVKLANWTRKMRERGYEV